MLNSGQPATLFDIISRIESRGFLHALRFEPTVYAHFSGVTPNDASYRARAESIVTKIMQCNRCTKETARIIYSTSYGAVQIMGFNLYSESLHFTGSIVDYMLGETAQRMAFGTFCAAQKIICTPTQLAGDPELRDRFAKTYNGSINYRGLICDALRFFNFVVVSAEEIKAVPTLNGTAN